MKIKILIPVYNDWKSVSKLLDEINNLSIDSEVQISVIIVNDASNHDRQEEDKNLDNIFSIKILNMKVNQGHARCIAAGLKYIYEKEDFDFIIPMDGDGEDRPEELSLLLEKTKEYPNKVITADRIKRSEGFIFKFCYLVHKYLTYIFTGQSIKFGNYTCLPKFVVNKMINEPSTWVSFSGSLAKLIKDRISIPSIRGFRYFGPSKMSFWNLIKHSLSIIAVFKKTTIIRAIFFLFFYILFVYQFLSIITLIPVFGIMALIYTVISISHNENIYDAIAFRQGDRINETKNNLDIAYKAKYNSWNGNKSIQLTIEDFKVTDT